MEQLSKNVFVETLHAEKQSPTELAQQPLQDAMSTASQKAPAGSVAMATTTDSISPIASSQKPSSAPVASASTLASIPRQDQRDETNDALPLVQQFCTALDEAAIVYCHWKSNAALNRSETGLNDLDLLISRSHRERFAALVAQLGFKEALHDGEAALPGVQSYYGFDRTAERLVHVHAHYQLVLGQDRTKNFRIPIEEAYLASRAKSGLFYIPTVEFEFVIFTLRMMLKYGTWDAVLSRQARLPKAARGELTYLLARINWDEVHDILDTHLPSISPQLFDRCARAIEKGPTLITAINQGSALTKALETYTRAGAMNDLWQKGWRRLQNAYLRRRYGQTHKAHMAGGGTMIALIGGDGAGKSTAIKGLNRWLAKDLAVRRIHLGKPPRSLSTHLVRLSVRVARQLQSRMKEMAAHEESRVDYGQIFLQYCIARDRYWTYVKARRFVNNGGIVIADRFPVQQIQVMEGAKIAQLAGDKSDTPLLRRLAKGEEWYYSRFLPPEVLVVLRLDPATAVARKPEEPADQVFQRSSAIWQAQWHESKATVVDAAQSAEQVLGTIKELVWAAL